jgi:hypothetical protein
MWALKEAGRHKVLASEPHHAGEACMNMGALGMPKNSNMNCN